jgi:nitrogen regulatory protein P-II 1
MKEIKAIVKPHIVNKVIRALPGFDHIAVFPLLDIEGQGRGRGAEEYIEYHRKAMIVVVCSDELATIIAEAIQNTANAGNEGDGIIIVSEVAEVIRIPRRRKTR